MFKTRGLVEKKVDVKVHWSQVEAQVAASRSDTVSAFPHAKYRRAYLWSKHMSCVSVDLFYDIFGNALPMLTQSEPVCLHSKL